MSTIRRSTQLATIAAEATKTDGMDMGPDTRGGVLVGIVTPANFAGTSITFEASLDGSTYVPVRDEFGGLYTIAAGASRYTAVRYVTLMGARYIKIVSNVAQGAATPATLRLAMSYPN